MPYFTRSKHQPIRALTDNDDDNKDRPSSSLSQAEILFGPLPRFNNLMPITKPAELMESFNFVLTDDQMKLLKSGTENGEFVVKVMLRIKLFAATNSFDISNKFSYFIVNGIPLDMSWPSRIFTGNNNELALDITPQLRISDIESNSIQTVQIAKYEKFCFVLSIVRLKCPESLLTILKRRPVKPSDETVNEMMKLPRSSSSSSKMSSCLLNNETNNSNTSEDLVLLTPSCRKIKLTCPLTMARLVTPTRSRSCRHIEAFDAYNYLVMNENKEQKSWKCPICKAKAPFSDLVVDQFLLQCLQCEKENNYNFCCNPGQCPHCRHPGNSTSTEPSYSSLNYGAISSTEVFSIGSSSDDEDYDDDESDEEICTIPSSTTVISSTVSTISRSSSSIVAAAEIRPLLDQIIEISSSSSNISGGTTPPTRPSSIVASCEDDNSNSRNDDNEVEPEIVKYSAVLERSLDEPPPPLPTPPPVTVAVTVTIAAPPPPPIVVAQVRPLPRSVVSAPPLVEQDNKKTEPKNAVVDGRSLSAFPSVPTAINNQQQQPPPPQNSHLNNSIQIQQPPSQHLQSHYPPMVPTNGNSNNQSIVAPPPTFAQYYNHHQQQRHQHQQQVVSVVPVAAAYNYYQPPYYYQHQQPNYYYYADYSSSPAVAPLAPPPPQCYNNQNSSTSNGNNNNWQYVQNYGYYPAYQVQPAPYYYAPAQQPQQPVMAPPPPPPQKHTHNNRFRPY